MRGAGGAGCEGVVAVLVQIEPDPAGLARLVGEALGRLDPARDERPVGPGLAGLYPGLEGESRRKGAAAKPADPHAALQISGHPVTGR